MTTALQKRVADAALKRMADAATAAARTDLPVANREVATVADMRTFVHTVAGANTILPDSRKLVFGGKPGGLGYYVTNNVDEIEWLVELTNAVSSQVTEQIVDKIIEKEVDPAIQQAADDSKANSERIMNPQASAAVENLAKYIAASGTE